MNQQQINVTDPKGSVNGIVLSLLSLPPLRKLFTALGPIEARLVGGCVRDALLGIASKDIDLAVAADPNAVLKKLTFENIKVIPTGLKFGTVTAVIAGQKFELTSLRSDVKTDGRRAEVAFGTSWAEDAKRRDFTINALYLDKFGNIYDYFNGRRDLERGHIRFIGNPQKRIAEDSLRILRYYRFLAHFGNSAHPTIPALRQLGANLRGLSIERIQRELINIFLAKRPEFALQTMINDKTFNYLYGEKICQEKKYQEKLLGESRLTIKHLLTLLNTEQTLKYPADPLTRLYVFLYPLSSCDDKFYKTYFRLPRVSLKFLQNLDCLLEYDDNNWVMHRYGKDFLTKLLLVQSALVKGCGGKKPEKLPTIISWANAMPVTKLPINGRDLIENGIATGSNLKHYLMIVERWWLDNDFKPTKQQCLDYIINNHI